MPGVAEPALQLAPASGRSRAWLFALCVALPLGITFAALTAATFGIGAPAGAEPKLLRGSWPLTFAASLGMVAAIALPTWAILDRLMRRRAMALEDGALVVRSMFHRCATPLADLDLAHARIVDLAEHPGLRPGVKTNGYAAPGFRSGWFYHLGRRRKTFVATADGRRKLWLPARGGHDLLLEPRDPRAALERLREVAALPAG
ncbi:MAG: hypothetical protein ACTHOC_10730 [Luteimonas sp.]